MPCLIAMKFKNRLVVFSSIIFILTIFINLWYISHKKSPIKCIKFSNETNKNSGTIMIKCGSTYVERKLKPFVKTDNYDDLTVHLNQKRKPSKMKMESKEVVILEEIDLDNPTLGDMIGVDRIDWPKTNLGQFQMAITKQELYTENDPLVDGVISDMINLPIKNVSRKKYGTQVKFVLDFGEGIKALFKPQRLLRNEETDPNHYYFQEFERHNSEIAAFHLDRALGFRRVMPAVGRRVNLDTEIFKYADKSIQKTFFTSPANNLCFYGTCMLYCTMEEAVCGNPYHIEGSLSAFLPEFDEGHVWVCDLLAHNNNFKETIKHFHKQEWPHPWKRTYLPDRDPRWLLHPDNYCDKVKTQDLYFRTKKLLDVMDLSILDFLMGNLDRHNYEYFTIWGNDSTTIHLDNGRGFGKAFEEDLNILAGITHCCLIREGTLRTLLRLHNGPKPLSKIMNESMSTDPLAPILADQHLIALDRRVDMILKEIRKCVNQMNISNETSLTLI